MWLDEIDKIAAWIWCIVKWVVEGGLIVKSNYFFTVWNCIQPSWMHIMNDIVNHGIIYFGAETHVHNIQFQPNWYTSLKTKKNFDFESFWNVVAAHFFLLSKYKFPLNFSYLVIYFSFVILKLCHSSIFR